MQRSVHAHAPVPRTPVELERHVLADRGALAHRLSRHMRDLGLELVVVDSGREGEFAGGCYEHAAVARLPARRRIEAGAIDHDATFLGEAEHGRGRRSQVRIFAEQAVGRHETLSTSARIAVTRVCDAPWREPGIIATNLNS